MSVTVAALTTTFTPAPSCTNLVFSSPIYKVWLNEPVPMASTTMTECFPSEWLNGYASVSPSSSIAPMMSPLVCPSGWTTAWRTSTSYIACCPTNYALHYPDTTVDTNRPAYGGTCFSDITSGQTLTVTEYGPSSIIDTQTVTSTLSGGQAFAHVIDGIMVQAPRQTPAPTAAGTMVSGLTMDTVELAATASTGPTAGILPASTQSTSDSAVTGNRPPSAGLSAGNAAAIAVGIIGVIAMIGALAIFFIFRRKYKSAAAASKNLDNQNRDNPPAPWPKDGCWSPGASSRGQASPVHGDYHNNRVAPPAWRPAKVTELGSGDYPNQHRPQQERLYPASNLQYHQFRGYEIYTPSHHSRNIDKKISEQISTHQVSPTSPDDSRRGVPFPEYQKSVHNQGQRFAPGRHF